MTEITQTTFQVLLGKFNKLVDLMPPIPEVKEKLEKLSEIAKNHPDLNGRQREAITDRVRYYLNGEYGRSQKKTTYMNENK